MIARLGNVLYWLCNGVAVIILIGAALALGFLIFRGSTDIGLSIASVIAMAIAAMISWLIGRATRYVLVGR